jgi:predicted Zn-dependent protease
MTWIHSITEKTTYRTIRNEKLEESHSVIDQGIRVEVMENGAIGYAGTQDSSSESIQRAEEKARALARASLKNPLFTFSEKVRPYARGLYKTPVQKSFDAIGLKQIMDVLKDCSQSMNISEKIVQRVAGAIIVETQIHSKGPNGAETVQDFSIVALNIGATAQDGNDVQTRTLSGRSSAYQIGSELFSRHRLIPNCETVAKQALELVQAENCPNDKRDLLIGPDQMYIQIHESIGHPLELDRILGDERNYAGWSFVKQEDFGQLQYGSPLMNITFDPTRFGEIASYNFDDSGMPAKKEHLIKDGILVRSLGGLESQERAPVSGVANFRSASWNRAPIDRMGNINMEPGSSTLEEMIGSMKKGLVVHSNKSWSIDDYRDKFQFGCEYGQIVEDGKITKVVKNSNYRGRTLDFWRNLTQVGDSLETYGTLYCGKGEPSQIIRVGHAAPYCLFKDIEIFGGGS